MVAKRIIPCLDVTGGRTVKGVNFLELRDAGDPVELAARYEVEGADELAFLDISATGEGRKTLITLVRKVAETLSIPFMVGGGISSVEDMYSILRAGADKVSVNSSAVRDPELITRCAKQFGSQCVVVAIDAKQVGGRSKVHISGGKIETDKETLSWAKEVVERGAGEILLTSMDHDGCKEGFALELVHAVANATSVPVIASGGGGTAHHFRDVFIESKADAALAASVFHFSELHMRELKTFLHGQGIEMRL